MKPTNMMTMLVVTALLGAGTVTGLDAGDGIESIVDLSALPDDEGFQSLQSWGNESEGFLGIRPSESTVPTLELLFAGLAPEGALPPGPVGWSAAVVENLELERPVMKYSAHPLANEADDPTVPLHTPAPRAATGIGPGAHLIITIPGEGTFGCTSNYVWEDGDDLYLGAAGHCFLPEDEVATHGETPASANYDSSRVKVEVCVAQCYFGGQMGFLISGTLEELGEVVYARQTGPGGDVGNDFGLVYIPEDLHGDVRTEMPVWGGPTGEGRIRSLEPVVHYGYGVVVGETFLTMARAGVSIFDTTSTSPRWAAEMASAPGDSGSAVNRGVVTADTHLLHGDQAGGILTHLVGSAEIVAGTTIVKAKAMATQASLTISVKV